MKGWLHRTFLSLSNHHFRTLWAGSLFSFVAFFMSTVVQAVVAFDLTGNNGAVGLVVFGQGLAQLLLGPFGGALADRVNKKYLILACQVLTFLVFVGLSALVAADLITVAALTVGSFLNGVSFSFLGPSRQAFVVELVQQDRRGNAVALNQVALNASRVVGPGIAGVLLAIEVIGATGAYMVMSALYGVAILATFRLPSVPPPTEARQRSILGDISDGFAYVAREARLRVLVLYFVTVMMVGFPYVTVLPGFVENELGRESTTISLLLSATAGGALLASTIVASLADSPRAILYYSGAALLFSASLLFTAAAPGVAAATVGMVVVGVGSGAFQTLNGAVIIRESDPRYFGRVMSLTFLAFAGFGLMGLPIGFFADAYGERVTLALMGVVVAALVVLMTAILLRLPAQRTVPAGAPGGGSR